MTHNHDVAFTQHVFQTNSRTRVSRHFLVLKLVSINKMDVPNKAIYTEDKKDDWPIWVQE
jgi:hypothetical protein